ncbi:MAG: hypothetical protein Q4C81_09545 [Kocuria sp.]|nr:hypothetical protein [Kocuria sp.]
MQELTFADFRRRAVSSVCVVGLVVGVALSAAGCAEHNHEFLPAPNIPSDASPTETPVMVPASAEECFAVTEVYVALTLLPLETTADASAVPLDHTADSLEQGVQELPQDMRQPFQDVAEISRQTDHGLDPQTATEVRDTLQPVRTWLSQRCSSTPND